MKFVTKLTILTIASILSFSTLSVSAARADGSKSSAVDLGEFDHLDPHHVVPDGALRQALTYYKQNRSRFPNKNYIVVVDFTQPASAERMYIINLNTGAVERHLTAAGSGSDPNKDGIATRFSNSASSHASSLGFYRTAEVYNGKHGRSLRLDGLSPTNSNARSRDVVVHAANYVSEAKGRAGTSWGCFALDPRVLAQVIAKIKNGAMIYAYGNTK